MTDAELVQWVMDESGLTWDQIARAFGVSRRTVHLWAGGARLSAMNAEALYELAEIVRKASAGSPAATRSALLKISDGDGISPFDQFRRDKLEKARPINGTFLSVSALLGDPDDVLEPDELPK